MSYQHAVSFRSFYDDEATGTPVAVSQHGFPTINANFLGLHHLHSVSCSVCVGASPDPQYHAGRHSVLIPYHSRPCQRQA